MWFCQPIDAEDQIRYGLLGMAPWYAIQSAGNLMLAHGESGSFSWAIFKITNGNWSFLRDAHHPGEMKTLAHSWYLIRRLNLPELPTILGRIFKPAVGNLGFSAQMKIFCYCDSVGA